MSKLICEECGQKGGWVCPECRPPDKEVQLRWEWVGYCVGKAGKNRETLEKIDEDVYMEVADWWISKLQQELEAKDKFYAGVREEVKGLRKKGIKAGDDFTMAEIDHGLGYNKAIDDIINLLTQ